MWDKGGEEIIISILLEREKSKIRFEIIISNKRKSNKKREISLMIDPKEEIEFQNKNISGYLCIDGVFHLALKSVEEKKLN